MNDANDSDIGNAWTAFILGQLFSNWPRRQDLNAMDVAAATGMEPRHDPEEMFEDLVRWLHENGYVRIGQEGDSGNFYGVSLTNQGFSVLGEQPSGFDRPLGTKLKEVASSTGGEIRSTIIAELVGAVVGAAAKQFIS